MTILDSLVEVKLIDSQNFLKIKETLTRIGVSSKKEKKLFQSCHILHKQGKYYLVHFKELFALDGKPTNFSDEDKKRRNTIALLLEEWGLITVPKKDEVEKNSMPLSQIKILTYKEKDEWELVAKYNIGRKKI